MVPREPKVVEEGNTEKFGFFHFGGLGFPFLQPFSCIVVYTYFYLFFLCLLLTMCLVGCPFKKERKSVGFYVETNVGDEVLV